MEKINIKNIDIQIDIQKLSQKINSGFLAIDLQGDLIDKKDDIKNRVLIFKNENLNEIDFDKNDFKDIVLKVFAQYKPQLVGMKAILKPLSNWQNIIELNKTTMLYFDHQSDGVELFEDEVLEEYGWHASALDISYREITQHIENSCSGVLLCYENDVQFNGFAVVDDIQKVRQEVSSYIVKVAKQAIEEGSIDLDDEDASEACEFFKIEV
ncbi:MAG: hypothetical protein ACQERD_06830 [Campylobacterota bacterium]